MLEKLQKCITHEMLNIFEMIFISSYKFLKIPPVKYRQIQNIRPKNYRPLYWLTQNSLQT